MCFGGFSGVCGSRRSGGARLPGGCFTTGLGRRGPGTGAGSGSDVGSLGGCLAGAPGEVGGRLNVLRSLLSPLRYPTGRAEASM